MKAWLKRYHCWKCFVDCGNDISPLTQVEHLLKRGDGSVCGAHVRDRLTGEEWDVRAKTVINATGMSVCACVSLTRVKC